MVIVNPKAFLPEPFDAAVQAAPPEVAGPPHPHEPPAPGGPVVAGPTRTIVDDFRAILLGA